MQLRFFRQAIGGMLCVSLLMILAMGGAWAASDPIEVLDPAMAAKDAEAGLCWYDALSLGLEGQGWQDTAHPYDRLPKAAKGVVRAPVWSLSHDSAGLCVRFVSDAPKISARWSLRDMNLAMGHMTAIGVSGLDLYARAESGWRWVGVGWPKGKENTAELLSATPGGMQEYLLYLPLYNGVDKVEIGIAEKATLGKAPARPEAKKKPVFFYGTSITQGGCASRPGMAYPALLGRALDRPSINQGFSGNGKMDLELLQYYTQVDPAIYVLDNLPNMNADLLHERVGPFVRGLREAHPDTPIVIVENIEYQQSWFHAPRRESYEKKNEALKEEYEKLLAAGVKGLSYVPFQQLYGEDGEGTVDGCHGTDLGFYRIAQTLLPLLKSLE